MLVKRPFYTKPHFWRWALVVSLVLVYCGLFWNDVVGVFLRVGWNLVLGVPNPVPSGYVDPRTQLPQAIENLVKFVLAFAVFLPVFILFVSQFILPVRTLAERQMVFDRLMRYASGTHGPAIFIHEGKYVARAEELNLPYPGVIFVDMSSAIVLERKSKPAPPDKPIRTLADQLAGRPGVYRLPKVVRAEGPGIVFMSEKERIRGVADLRRQMRANNGAPGPDGKPEGVKAYTGDGIEVSSAALPVIFTLGQLPDVLDVAYVGGEKPENLRVITIGTKNVKEQQGNEIRWRKVEFVKAISVDGDLADMDLEDKREIHGFAQDRLQIETFLEVLERYSLDETAVLSFVRSLGLKRAGAVEQFINSLYANRQAVYRTFVNRMKPVDTDMMHRFVINKGFLYQLADALTGDKSEAAQVRSFIDQLFTTYRGQVLDFYSRLDDTTRNHIARFVRRFYTEQQIPSSYRPPRQIGSSPFYFDERRVFAALYANARYPGKEDSIEDWTKLPSQVATEYYRTFIAHYTLNELLGLDNLEKPPMVGKAKAQYSRAVRHQGVLAYRLIRRRDGEDPRVGDILTPDTYRLDHPVLELRNPKVLRDRGIKVIAAAFSELRISDPEIRQQRLDNWMAHWQSTTEETMSEFEIDIMRSRAQARAKAQRELIQNLSNIFSQPYTKEAMAVRIFQSLESAAADPETRRLLPQDTLAFIQNLRGWLLKDTPPGTPPPAPPEF
ncbi:MAG: hypothetical protein ACOYYS_26490 [Chloroflexota bacterium]